MTTYTGFKSVVPIVGKGIDKRFGLGRPVLRNVDIQAGAGEVLLIKGASGSGKSTLLHILSGLEKPTKGTVNAPRRTQRGFIFQDFGLMESLTAEENALLSARVLGTRVTGGSFAKAFDLLGIAGLERRLPHQLSGGQQQRIAVARVLLANVPYIFADEPTASLDRESAAIVLSSLRRRADEGAVVIVVSHSDDVHEIADRVFTLGAGCNG